MSTPQLPAADGHRLSAWIARPGGSTRGAVVMGPVNFGVNAHLRRTARQCAASAHGAFERAIGFFHEQVG